MNDTHPNDEKTIQNIRRLIWLYFWLLLFEGALRKWVLPQLSNPLLIIRDPVVIAAYFLAIKARVFPWNKWVYALGIISGLSMAVSVLQLWPYLPPRPIVLVTAFGFRANFLHLPLIFVMARVLRPEDLKRIGWWALVLLVPMSMLLVAQFRASPDAFLNRTAGGEGEMMTSALGKVRTAGTFSFVIGVVAYFALSTGFLVWAALRRDVYKSWVLFAAGAALVIGIAVSGSRSVVGACAVVVASLAAVLFLRPSAVNRLGQTLVIAVVLGFIVMQTPIFKEGFNVLSTRFTEAAEATEKSVGGGMVERVFHEFSEGVYVWSKAPFLGFGLGIGTNAGAKFLTGRQMFLLSEGEWPRIFLESGQLLGLAYVIWRCAIVVSVGLLCVRAVKAGNILPLLIFSSAFLPMLHGQFGQPTILGFAVFAMGLALAAQKQDVPGASTSGPGEMQPVAQPVRRIARRSEYASRLHGSAPAGGQSNGSNHH
jgi:hypothetical protein